ncbi:MAG TPA: hypothetical protein VNH21_12380 [Steroidobacteraceae bacterium]|nr:hypothetical protein [Steroidobacteraceae bacterium]
MSGALDDPASYGLKPVGSAPPPPPPAADHADDPASYGLTPAPAKPAAPPSSDPADIAIAQDKATAADLNARQAAPDTSAATVHDLLAGARDTVQQADTSALTALAPGPDAGMVERFGRRAAQLGVHTLAAIAGVPLNLLAGATEGPWAGATINPETNTLGITPEGLAAGTILGGGGGLRFSGATPRAFVPPGTMERRPIPADVAPNLIGPEATARITAAEGKPVPVAPPATVTPLSPAASTEAPKVSATGVPVTAPAAPVPAAAVPVPPAAIPAPSDAAREVASAYYGTFDQAKRAAGALTPNVANKVVGAFESRLDPAGMGQALGGDELRGIVAKLQQYKNKPMSLADVQAVDTRLGDLIHRESDPIKGMSPLGRQLMEIQDDVRGITEHPAPSDVMGGQAGLDALAPAREAYAAAKRMQEVERLWERAQGTQNPRSSFQIQIRNLLDNRRRSAGFNEEERAALKDAARIGLGVGGAVHLMGSRIIPAIAGAAEVGTGGVTAGAAAFGTSYVLGSAVRKLEKAMAARKYGTAMGVLGHRVPAPPP